MKTLYLFCYGSLQVPKVMKTVIGREATGQPGNITGYVMYRMKNAEYPGITPKPGHSVPGVLCLDLSERDLKVLDAFEGEQYQRDIVDVHISEKQTVQAWAYIVKEERRHELTREGWSLSDFMANDFERFLKRFVIERKEDYFQQ